MQELVINSKKIEENREKYKKLYKSKDKIIVRGHFYSGVSYSQVDLLESWEKEFEALVANHNMHMESANLGLDNIPSIAFDFGAAAYLMNLAYGGKLIKIGGRINGGHIIDNIDDVFKILKPEKIYECGLYPEIFERINLFQDNYKEVMIPISDNQSPIDVLTCIFESSNAILGMYDEPEKIHYLMNIITDSIIEINMHFENEINNFGGFSSEGYLPYGIHVSDDNAAFLSPKIYEEFAKPYMEKLAKEFGKLSFHCCMGYEQNLESMASIKGFSKFDPQVDFNNIDKIIDVISNKKAIWVVNNWPFQKNKSRKQSDESLFKEIIDRTDGKTNLLIDVYDYDKEKATDMALRIKDYANNKGRLI